MNNTHHICQSPGLHYLTSYTLIPNNWSFLSVEMLNICPWCLVWASARSWYWCCQITMHFPCWDSFLLLDLLKLTLLHGMTQVMLCSTQNQSRTIQFCPEENGLPIWVWFLSRFLSYAYLREYFFDTLAFWAGFCIAVFWECMYIVKSNIHIKVILM